MEKIGLDLLAKVYVETTNGKIVCSLDTVEYLNEQMNRNDIDKISITVPSLLKEIKIKVKKSLIKKIYKK